MRSPSVGSLLARHAALLAGVLTVVLGALAAPAAAGAAATADVIVSARGDTSGYHLYEADRRHGWAWRALVTIDPGADSEDAWTGYQCVTSDARHAVVVLAPRHAANDPILRQRGALAYSVDLASGAARPLAAGVALMYFDPGCGAGGRVALTRYLGSEQQHTEVFVYDVASGRLRSRATYAGELTSAVPTADGLIAAAGPSVVRLAGSHMTRLALVPGTPFDLRAVAGGADFLVATPSGKALLDGLHGTQLRGHGWAALAGSDLFAATDGHAVVALRDGRIVGYGPRARTPAGELEAASSAGDVLLSYPPARPGGGRGVSAARAAAAGTRGMVELTSASGRQLSRAIPSGNAPTVTALPASARGGARARAAVNTTTPKCGVPRLETNRQVLQPNATEVDWAVQQATRGNLKGSVLTRPKNYANMGFAAYQPSVDLPPPALSGYAGVPIPRSVIEAILAQESNFDQASFHALPGVGGDPLIADYYGAQGGISQINYELADCGYGIGQITTGMTAESTTPYSSEEKAKIAVDYTENIAAAIQILGSTWNTLAANGVTLNGGNPNYLENWYFATWAYNTGFHANTGSGPWGLGWTNNPQNASYPPNRPPFLRDSYEDAAHPSEWPYQERIIGWMETPLLNYRGQPSYEPANGGTNGHYLRIPAFSTFCTASNNCSPSYKNPENAELDYCERSDRECWWHLPVTYAECPSFCATSSFTTPTNATEPADDQTYLPMCESPLPSGTIVVDDEPKDLNVRGCTASNWKSKGTFKVKYGLNASKVPIGEIDWHQLGTGFGGHLYFTHNRPSTDTEHIDTGTWTPGTIAAGIYAVQAHIPVNGATTTEATYHIYPGDGTSHTATINQHVGGNQWVQLGDYNLSASGAKVELTNVTKEPAGTKDVAYDAVAFTFIAHGPNTEQNLALKFEPVLKFDSAEKWRPLNLTAFFGETESKGLPAQHKCIPYESPDAESILGEKFPYKHTAGDYWVDIPAGESFKEEDIARCQTTSSIEDATSWRSPDAYIDIGPLGHSDEVESYRSPHAICVHNGLLDCNGNEQTNDPYSAQYYYIADDSGHQFIQYWQYYRYNSFSNTILFGHSHHEGDWEAVAIAPSPDGSHFEYASFSQHGAWYSYLRSVMQCSDQADGTCGTESAPRGQRVVDYVAEGDHANYPYACTGVTEPEECPRGSGELIGERNHDGKDTWGHAFDGQGLLPMPAPGTGSWSDWPGHWGATPEEPNSPWLKPGYASPKSPASQQKMFLQPWGSCGKDIKENTCALPARARAGRSQPLASAAALVGQAASCGNWFGGDVAALVCSPSSLGSDVAHNRLGRQGRLTIAVRGAVRGRRWGAAEGIAQVVGAPLRVGEEIVLSGRLPADARLAVRVANGGRLYTRSLALPHAGRRVRVAIEPAAGAPGLRILEG